MTEQTIVVEGLTVAYGDVVALEGVNLSVGPGVCGLVGMNGSGKTTLFKAIMGLVAASRGHVTVAGHAPARAHRKGQVGYIPQSEEVDWTFPLSVADVVMMGRYGRLGPTRRPHLEDHVAVRNALDRVELLDLAGRQIGALSGGQRKRAFLARALAQDASIMLLDEPFAGVDKPSETMISRLLRERAARGTTIMISTHDLHALPALCDEAILIDGRVLLHDRTEVVLRPENLAMVFGIGIVDGADDA